MDHATPEGDDEETTDDTYIRGMGSPRRRLLARRTLRPGHGSAGGVAGRADARRTQPGARVGEAPDGAPLGADSVACGGRRYAGRHFSAFGAPPGRNPLAAREPRGRRRSEEHTSELQSHSDLVCRLLLEKKKT